MKMQPHFQFAFTAAMVEKVTSVENALRAIYIVSRWQISQTFYPLVRRWNIKEEIKVPRVCRFCMFCCDQRRPLQIAPLAFEVLGNFFKVKLMAKALGNAMEKVTFEDKFLGVFWGKTDGKGIGKCHVKGHQGGKRREADVLPMINTTTFSSLT